MSNPSTLLRTAAAVPSFDEEWAKMKPIVLKLLDQEPVTKREWQDLFWAVHSTTSWIDKGPLLVAKMLKVEIAQYIDAAAQRIAQATALDSSGLISIYVTEWRKFHTQSLYLPLPFAQLNMHLPINSNDSGSGLPISSASQSTSSSPRAKPPVYHSPRARGGRNSTANGIQEESFVRRIMLESWNRDVFFDIQNTLKEAAMQLVKNERSGDRTDPALVIGVRESFVSLPELTDMPDEPPSSLYHNHFESGYVAATESHYRAAAPAVLAANGVLAYLRYADEKLTEEEIRGRRYLDAAAGCCPSIENLLVRCVAVLVVDFQDQILGECAHLIERGEIEKLKLMYRLLDRTPSGIAPMLQHLEEHIRAAGLRDMLDHAATITSDPERYIEQLLRMYRDFSSLVKEAFADDPRFLTSRDKAFKEVVNDTSVFRMELPMRPQPQGTPSNTTHNSLAESRCPELLACYCDLLLRKSPLSKRLSSEEVDSALGDVLLVLKYVQNKDVFMRYHKAHLARRLILDASADSEKEECMVTRLRDAGMPAEYINRLYRMLLDVEVSRDLNKTFKSLPLTTTNNNTRSHAGNDVIVTIKVLNAGAWMRSSAERYAITLPRQIEDVIPEIDDFYKAQHNGRKLRWPHHLSHGTVQHANAHGVFDLEVSTYQIAILFAFNSNPGCSLSFEHLQLATGLCESELRRNIWSLIAFPKLKQQLVLCNDLPSPPHPRALQASSHFLINPEFALYKHNRVQPRGRLNLIGRLHLGSSQAPPADATTRTQIGDDEGAAIVQLRILRVQEAIVKIMKTRKKLTHAQLQTELVELLKNLFLPARRLIKEQIEWLIEHNYIERDKNDLNTFLYVT